MKSKFDETSVPSRTSEKTVDDWRGLGDLIVLATERLTVPVEGMHRAIADRWFGLAGPRAAPIRQAYQAFAGGIYGSVRLTGSALGAAVGLGAAAAGGLRPLFRSSPGSGIQAVANAVWGDELEFRRSDLRIELGLRDTSGRPIGSDGAALVRAFPKPTARLVVLLHGLGETERCWQENLDDAGAANSLGDVLAADSFTPLLVRYNSGRHVSDNGRDLSALLENISDSWPVPVEEIALVGNSMGGLVARSSIYAAQTNRHHWVDVTRHLVAVGAPHLGAPLEKGVNLMSWGLRVASESRPIGEFLDQRSSGIKDLRFGAIREEEWRGVDPAALIDGVVADGPSPEGLQQHFVAGVVTGEPTHPIGVLVGDLIVRTGSGTGRGRRRTIAATDVRVIGKRRHSDLAGDPAVHEQVRDWLATRVAHS
ncbi:MAG: GPI inositol-deacylase [Acidimicrobiia bacterium]|nr:GPI inositol-deacylase [Acidimicrobiia bacterium]